jgi:hypothetical protein
MATTILGIDLGTYSVKVARLEVSFRNVHLMSIEEQRLPDLPLAGPDSASSGEAASAESEDASSEHEPVEHSLLSRQMRALEALMVQQKHKGETSVVALGEEVTLRMVDMPLSDPKKVALTLPYELSGQLLTELDDQIVDQTMAQAAKGGGDTSTLWVAACVPHAAVRKSCRPCRRWVWTHVWSEPLRCVGPRCLPHRPSAPAALARTPSPKPSRLRPRR